MKRIIPVLGLVCALLVPSCPLCLAAEVPSVSAASAVLLDADSGRILYAKDANTPRAIASTTKLMTALVASEYLTDLQQEITIQKEWTGVEGTSLYLEPGEKLTAETLLYGLLLHSGNDAAVALAGYCAGDAETFVGWMNQRAADLGMTGTRFTDPNGLGGEDHYATALDMARLGIACLNDPTVSRIVATRTIRIGGRSFTNHNKLLWQYPGCTGMKTGYTRQAGRTLVSSAERDGQRLEAIQYAVHAPVDGAYTDAGLVITLQADMVAAIRAYGLDRRITEAEVRETMTEVREVMQTTGYMQVPTSPDGLSLQPFQEEDLIFAGVNLLHSDPAEAADALGDAEEAWIENGGDGCDFSEHCTTLSMWKKLYSAISSVVDHMSVQDMIQESGKDRETLALDSAML